MLLRGLTIEAGLTIKYLRFVKRCASQMNLTVLKKRRSAKMTTFLFLFESPRAIEEI